MAGMNSGLQKHMIKKKLRNKGINPDKIDLEAELDSSLTLPENIRNLEEKYGRLERTGRNHRARQTRAKAQRRDFVQREAEEINEKRPRWNRRIDESLQAEKVFRDPSEREFEKWRAHPDKYDIEGVDTKKPVEERTPVDEFGEDEIDIEVEEPEF